MDKEWRPIDDRVGGKSRKINPVGRGDREGDAPQKSKNQKSRIKNLNQILKNKTKPPWEPQQSRPWMYAQHVERVASVKS